MALFLLAAAGILLLFHLVGLLLQYAPPSGWPAHRRTLVHLNNESNLPTWFSTVLLLGCAAMLAVIASAARRGALTHPGHWIFLAFIFLLLSIDESARVHERTIVPLRRALDTGGLFYYAWVVPAIGFLVVLAAAYLRFLLALPPPVRTLVVCAAAVYLGGALGVEMLGAAWAEAHGATGLEYDLLVTVEESLEIGGLVIFAFALLQFMSDLGSDWGIRLVHAGRRSE